MVDSRSVDIPHNSRIGYCYKDWCLTAFGHIKDISMKISDLVKSLEKIKAKHGDLPIAFEVSDDDCCPIKKIHVKKIYDDDSTVSEAGFCEVRNLGDGEKYLNISDMLGG